MQRMGETVHHYNVYFLFHLDSATMAIVYQSFTGNVHKFSIPIACTISYLNKLSSAAMSRTKLVG